MIEDRFSIIDDARTTCLCDVGGPPGYIAATVVSTAGVATYLLAAVEFLGDPSATYDANCAEAAHEQTGPLPPRWRDRIQLAPARCGRRTKTGGRCRAYVGRPGDACGWHKQVMR
jgi:hypothetical protein